MRAIPFGGLLTYGARTAEKAPASTLVQQYCCTAPAGSTAVLFGWRQDAGWTAWTRVADGCGSKHQPLSGTLCSVQLLQGRQDACLAYCMLCKLPRLRPMLPNASLALAAVYGTAVAVPGLMRCCSQ